MNRFAMEFDAKTQSFTRINTPELQLRSGEVLVEVICCTICGSDLHSFCGRRSVPANCVLGHEIIGRISGWADGDVPRDYHGMALRYGLRVTWAMAVGCGTCFYCRNRLNQKCKSLFKYGHESGGIARPTGGLSTHCVLVPGTPIFRIPDELSDEVSSPANCATATVCAAMRLIQETHPVVGATALIMGAGMLGVTASAQLSDLGARHVVVADPIAERLKIMSSFGATHTVSATNQGELQAVLSSLTEGRGADLALDFAGVSAAVETCLASVRVGGCVLLAGSVFSSGDVSVSPEQFVRRMLTVRGLHNYLPQDLNSAIEFLQRTRNRFSFGDLVAQEFSLDQTQQAFLYANEHRPVRVAVKPKQTSGIDRPTAFGSC